MTSHSKDHTTQELLSDAACRLPLERLLTYSRLWQFETWLRTAVYVELRARYGNDWRSPLGESAKRPYEKDKKLSHMPTREALPTSYMQLGSLLEVISREWHLFDVYLPPQEIWDAKLLEIRQIRHRIAHFRLGNQYDAERVEQLLRDVDQGFWHFCTSYNSAEPILPPSKDPVTTAFLHLNPFPWGEVEPGTWAIAGVADPSLLVSVMIEVLRRPWVESLLEDETAGAAGCFYDVKLHARDNREFEYSRFLDMTEHLHSSLCHICLDSLARDLRFTIPAVLGAKTIVEILERLVHAAEISLRPARPRGYEVAVGNLSGETWVDTFVAKYPEYILGPSNPLTFLAPDCPCSFFTVD